MKKKLWILSGVSMLFLSLYFLNPFQAAEKQQPEGEEEEYESLEDRFLQQFEQIKDPATGKIPKDKLLEANDYTSDLKKRAIANRTAALNWQERGPVYDFVGPSNGNIRGGAGGYTSGIVITALVDLASDPAGNIVFAGSTTGGLWRCTNFLSTAPPVWQAITDFAPNISVASICQNPASPNIMYLATGDGNTRDVRGYGIWKSINSGLSWSLLPNTTGFNTSFKILCDNAGNIYLATYGNGLRRSTDGGTTWMAITPAGLTANANYVTDIELSSTGRLHAAFGYLSSRVQHAYTDNPSAVSAFSWSVSSGIRLSTTTATRLELATLGNTLYAVTVNSSYNIDSCYKSLDGGASWSLQNTSIYTPTMTNGQGWYDITLQINPDNASEILVAGLDAYRSVNDGASITRATYWVTSAPYVHADHHFMQWYKVGTDTRILIGNDGGICQSYNGGLSYIERNQNLGIKQFYSCAISPTANENFLFAGAQDNGCHQLTNAGLSFSTEVTGGDGAYVHINQQNKQIQFGSYVYNRYRRSTNGGNNWSAVNFSDPSRPQFGGYFINPFDYDDAKNIMYASNAGGSGNNQILRWDNATTTGIAGATIFTIDELSRTSGSNASSFKVSPYIPDRVYIGGSSGKLLRINNASTAVTSTDMNANVTNIGSASFPNAYLNCINTGTTDNTLVAVFTNYGINNVWYSNNGGTNWTAVDGTFGAGGLPDMPIWWAVFEPGSDSKLIIGTEAGVYTTSAVNGINTVWAPEANFPLVRTGMLKIRTSDNTLVASTYGRGLWTAVLNSCALATVSTQPASQSVCSAANVTFNVTAAGTGLIYQWRKAGVNINGATNASYTINNVTATDAAAYDVVITNTCGNTTSSQAILTITVAAAINTQPANTVGCAGSNVNFSVAATGSGLTYQWRKGGTNISGATNSSLALTNISAADAGLYDVAINSLCGSGITSSAATLSIGNATSIGTQPASQTVCSGTTVIMNVGATGGGTLTYQWRKGGSNISGANGATYNMSNTATTDAGNYDVIVTGSCGTTTSSAAAIAVNPATVITTQPAAQTGCAGTAANFSVTATGTGVFSYQWRKNSVDIAGATSATYSIASTAIADGGNYDVIVTSSCGPATSLPAILTVNTGSGCVTALPNIDAGVTMLVLMPNTVQQATILRIRVLRPMKVDWTIIDAQGRTVMSFTQKLVTGQTDKSLQLGRLAAGVYYLNSSTEKGKLGTLRFEKL